MTTAAAPAAAAGSGDLPPLEARPVEQLALAAAKRSRELFSAGAGAGAAAVDAAAPYDEASARAKLACKVADEYAAAQHFDQAVVAARSAPVGSAAARTAFSQNTRCCPPAPPPFLSVCARKKAAAAAAGDDGAAGPSTSRTAMGQLIDSIPVAPRPAGGAAGGVAGPLSSTSGALIVAGSSQGAGAAAAAPGGVAAAAAAGGKGKGSAAVSRRIASKWPKPIWHAPWKLYRVISGHLGWVRCVAFDPSNEWFCTGAADRTIKLWDTGSGQLKLTLTGHIEQVTGLAVSNRHPYMFSCSLDKEVKCWDLEANKVIRNYHGHLSGVYCIALHPTLDLIMTGGRDATCRVWDMRTKLQVFALSGHTNTVAAVLGQPTDPQVITGSHDATVRLWDLRRGATMATLTYHKKSVRALAAHPTEHAFASAGADNIKKFKLPNGDFLHNMLQQQRAIINTLAVNEDGVLASGGDNGSLWFWDWRSGNCFQQAETIVQPGSLDAEAGIYAAAFDVSGSRLVTCEADKTIKMWREDPESTEETYPIQFEAPKDVRRF